MARIYPHLHKPQEHPDYHVRPLKVTTRDTLENKVRFMSLRKLPMDKDRNLINIKEALDMYLDQLKLGDVLWMHCDILLAKNLPEFLDEIVRRGAYLFDLWGYVPGSYSPKIDWGEYHVTPELHELIMSKLGGRFIGYDNGEQDGRYIGSYTPQQCPARQDAALQHRSFIDFFETMADHMQHTTTALCSLNYGHYFAREQNVLMLGAETAQALPSANLWYAYLRGAGKQYGLLWFGNASVYNRFAWKSYEAESADSYQGYACGPSEGTSISLLRRLIYLEYLYNSDMLGFESSLHTSKENKERILKGEPLITPKELWSSDKSMQFGEDIVLTPLGEVQHDCIQFVEERGQPGVLYTPFAVLLAQDNGFTMPRHLYTQNVYRSWGQMPYSQGDHQLHALFTLLYPGYENSGFFADERGFMTATPYGDSADVILTDHRPQTLHQYNLVVLGGEQNIDAEQADKLKAFVEQGGTLITFAKQAKDADSADWQRFLGIKNLGAETKAEKPQVLVEGLEAPITELTSYAYYPASLLQKTRVEAEGADGQPLVIRKHQGKGQVLTFLSAYGLSGRAATGPITNKAEYLVPQVYPFLKHVSLLLDKELRSQMLVDIKANEVTSCVNLLDKNTLTVTLFNNSWQNQPYAITLNQGREVKRTQITVPDTDPAFPGYYPKAQNIPSEEVPEGVLGPGQIVMFDIQFEDAGTETLPEIKDEDFAGNLYVSLRPKGSLYNELLKMPSLRTYFKGIKLDANYLREQDETALARCGRYLKRHGLSAIVDFSGMMNHYPDMSLLNNMPEKYAGNMELMEGLMRKAEKLNAEYAIFISQRNAENHLTPEDGLKLVQESISKLSAMAKAHGLKPLMQNGTPRRLAGKTEEGLTAFDLPLAYNPAHALLQGEDVKLPEQAKALLLSAPLKDEFGQLIDAHLPLYKGDMAEQLGKLGTKASYDSLDFVCLDGDYESFADMYLDRKNLFYALSE